MNKTMTVFRILYSKISIYSWCLCTFNSILLPTC